MLINITMKFSFFFSSQNIIYVHDKVYSVIYSMHITCIKALSLYKSVGLKILHKLLLWYTLVFADRIKDKTLHWPIFLSYCYEEFINTCLFLLTTQYWLFFKNIRELKLKIWFLHTQLITSLAYPILYPLP